MKTPPALWPSKTNLIACALLLPLTVRAATIVIGDSVAGQRQVIDGFGTCINDSGGDDWYQRAYYDDMGCSIMRMDLTPVFKSPYSDRNYNSPWFGNPPPMNIDDRAHPGGPDGNFVRTYTNAGDYTREFGGNRAAIAVMGPDITKNISLFNYDKTAPEGAMAKAGIARKARLGDFKLYGSIWSPAPWVKLANGQTWKNHKGVMPGENAPFPFIWVGNFAGGKVDTSNKPLEVFNDGTGPTSALTQFARCTAAYIKGFQDRYGVKFYAISIQNELNFPEFYNSCVYATSPEYIAALKTVRKEFNRYPDLKEIQITGPEDLLGDNAYGLWQYGSGDNPTHKNLQYLAAIGKDPEAAAALSFFCIHGYADDGATAAGADSQPWRWWATGWKESPAPGIPPNIGGFTSFHKKSWMTETSGETPAWLAPATSFPGKGAWSIALKMQQALTVGQESACLYWQFTDTDGSKQSDQALSRKEGVTLEPKYVAAKHFAKYIRPGAYAMQTTVTADHGVTASAFVHPLDLTLTVVLVNKSTTAEPASLTLPNDFSKATTAHVVTSSDGHLWQESELNPEAGKLKVTVPGYGVVTLFVRSLSP